MKKSILLAITLVSLVTLTTAVYDPNSSNDEQEGDISITSVEPDTTAEEIDKNFNQFNASCGTSNADEATISSETIDNETVLEIEGTYQTSNPCHELTYELVETDEGSELVINAEPTSDMCTQCVGNIEYNTSITLDDEEDNFEVVHNDTAIETYNNEDDSKENTGFIQRLFSLFSF